MDPDTQARLVSAAISARERSYAPYSNFKVGAALLFEDGSVYAGTNVENASYGLTICAERVAVGNAVSAHSARRIIGVAIATGSTEPAPPCGACRQVLAEFATDECVVSLHSAASGRTTETTLGQLLPRAFRPASMGSE